MYAQKQLKRILHRDAAKMYGGDLGKASAGKFHALRLNLGTSDHKFRSPCNNVRLRDS